LAARAGEATAIKVWYLSSLLLHTDTFIDSNFSVSFQAMSEAAVVERQGPVDWTVLMVRGRDFPV